MPPVCSKPGLPSCRQHREALDAHPSSWNRQFRRGRGGRLGGALAPILTMQLMLLWTFSHQYFSLAPDAVPSVSSWRPVMVVYGAVGILIGIIFMWFFRDSPSQHRRSIAQRENGFREDLKRMPSIRKLTLAHRSKIEGCDFHHCWPWQHSVPLWLTCFVQFASNFGWAFLVTKMPTYLSEVYGSSPQSQSWLQSIPLAAGIPGLFLGGFFTDLFVRRFGMRWGRSIAMAVSRLAVATAFASTFVATSAEMATLCFVWMSFSTDLGTPACWAYCQDVGGKNVGAVLGWANMWGNLGAALHPSPSAIFWRSIQNQPRVGRWFSRSVAVSMFLLASQPWASLPRRLSSTRLNPSYCFHTMNSLQERKCSLDQFRGYSVAAMFVVNFLGGLAVTHQVLKHNNTHFSTPTRLCRASYLHAAFPIVSLFLKRSEKDTSSSAKSAIIRRSLGLILLSLMLTAFNSRFGSWNEMNPARVGKFVAELLKANMWEVLAIIGAVQIFSHGSLFERAIAC